MTKGIDVSYAQGNIDFTKIDKSQVQFAVIRSSFGWESNQKDNQFERNYSNFKNLGIPIGAYHYSYARTKEQAVKEAKYCIECIKGKTFELPIYLDVEDNSVISAGKRNLTDVVKAFCDYMISQGYKAGFYTNPNWLNNYLYKDELIGKYNIWLAHWDVSSPAYTCGIWQYGVGGKGSVSGISGEIDLDYLMDNSLISKNTTTTNKQETSKTTTVTIFDRDKFLNMARSYIGKNGYYVCQTKLKLGAVYDWCAFAVSAIMKDCGFIGKYIAQIEGGAGSIPRESDGKYGTFFLKGVTAPQAGDLVLFRYDSYPNQDKYFSDHIGIVESVSGNTLTTLEGNVDGVTTGNWQKTSTFKRKTRYLSNSDVYAFYRPNWKNSTTTTSTKPTTNKQEISQLTSSASVNFSVKVATSAGVNIRSGASTSYDILGAVPNGVTLKVTKQTSGGNYKWGLITYNGVTGWIALNYTVLVNSAKTVIKKGNIVRMNKGAKVYGTTKEFAYWVYQTNLQVLESSGDRVVVGIDGKVTGAVKKSDLTLIK